MSAVHPGGTAVVVVTAAPDAPAAQAAVAALARGLHRVEVAAEVGGDDRRYVLVDDESLPQALIQLATLHPGRFVYENTVFVSEDPERTSGLLAEGMRDIVRPDDASEAVERLIAGRPPLFFERLRARVRDRFLPEWAATMRRRATERQAALGACLDLARAWALLGERARKLERLVERHLVDDLLVAEGEAERWAERLDRRLRLHPRSSPRPSAARELTPVDAREPRMKRRREFLEDAIEAARQSGLLGPLGDHGVEALLGIVQEHWGRPRYALKECMALIEARLDRLQKDAEEVAPESDPIPALRREVLDVLHLRLLPPGIVLIDHLGRVLESRAQPAAEIYLTWVLDLRDLALKPCVEVLDELVEALDDLELAAPEAVPPMVNR